MRDYWRTQGKPCARCGKAIAYSSTYYFPGTRTINPDAFVCGHIVSRDRAKQLGWTDEQINSIANTQPECARCSMTSGARDGNRKARGLRVVSRGTKTQLDTSRKW